MVGWKQNGWGLLPLGLLLSSAAMAQTPPPETSLRVALCLNDWNRAIGLLGPILSAEQVPPPRRQALVDFRQTLTLLRDQGVSGLELPGCNAVLPRYLPTVPDLPSPPLNWEAAIASTYGIGTTVPELSDQARRQQAGMIAAGLEFAQESDIAPLSPFTLLDTGSGSGVSAGFVDSGYEVYSFFGGQGDVITIAINVTEIYSGPLYTDDDSQLFLFDSQGILLADNDDFTGLQSEILDFTLPRTDRYYLAVTTYNNDPVLDEVGRITEWSGSGGSAIDFTVSVTGLTPLEDLALPQ